MALAFAPLAASEVISGTIIQAIDERGTMINVTPELACPRAWPQGLTLHPLNTLLAVAHNTLYGQANYCTVALWWTSTLAPSSISSYCFWLLHENIIIILK